ncbi:MAG: 50S ribosomal protein L11 methyltransferase [candidate division Zixibacteria bacterium]|nr:50S ribosomal protein L11 methyltransferase [candidate division Zixibacteria bacterium]
MTGETGNWYQEVTVRVPSERVDTVADYIIEHIAGGLLLEDEEQSVTTAVKFYLTSEEEIEPRLAGLRQFLATIGFQQNLPVFSLRKIRNLDWIDEYRKSVAPLPIGEAIVISPPWERGRYPGRTEIIIEPKMAFGTGRHETSRSCLAELERLPLKGKTVLDLGCGSGILGIYAALQGAAMVIGYDIDPLAVENSRENFVLNGVAAVCRAEEGSIDDVPAGETFDLIVANIIKSAIVPIIGELKRRLRPGGVVILSGLLQQDCPEIEAGLSEQHMTDFTIRRDAEWRTYTVRCG